MLVRLIRNYPDPGWRAQCPGGTGTLGGITFTDAPVAECDAVIICNHSPEDVELRCPPANVWSVVQEPWWPGSTEWITRANAGIGRIYSHHPVRQAPWRRSHPALPWHVGRSWDALHGMEPPDKADAISMIVSKASFYRGHRKRLDFADALSADLLERYGKGVRPVADKWDALAPLRYSVAVENSASPDYWTEKVADCWLAWTLPFYAGCPNLPDYVPPESFIRIDLSDPGGAESLMREAVASGQWHRRLEAIAEARRQVLARWAFFPFFAAELAQAPAGPRETVRIAGYDRRRLSPLAKLRRKAWRLANDLEQQIWAWRRGGV
ncbi:hypothetical protein HHL28_11630 [Aerophototrophica crusticola]|uniref:Fucosyltransferase C-terminal domain-containing protein n=1 Tax=Aerophototrophica crusticola TaxID=1709002 RepID=A0A858R8A1_9PROT|nr:hypothetical protein HHL28_11630 [Rhodospirillaceae bacterium B3]